MPKSIHFAPVPNMRGKLTMRYTDVVAVNLRPAIAEKQAKREVRDYEASVYHDYEDPNLGLYVLEKVSVPGWEKEFDSHADMIDELRKHVCDDCLRGRAWYVGDNGEEVLEEASWPAPDVVRDGQRYECRDDGPLLSTPCGLEYETHYG